VSKSNYSLVDPIYGLGTFESVPNGSSSTVKRTQQIAIPTPIVNAAAANGHLNNDGSVTYMNVYGKGDYEFLGAPESFKTSLATDPTYWNTINQSIDGQFANVAFSPDTEQLVSSPFNSQNESANQQSTIGDIPNLRYPLSNDGNFDYLKITCFEYVSSNLGNLGAGNISTRSATERITSSASERKTSTLFTVALPMQPGISESNSVGWGEDRLNALQIAGANIAGDAIQDFGSLNIGQGFKDFVSNIKQAAGTTLSGMSESDIIAYFAGQSVGANIFTRGTGQVLNPNLELLFTGPNLRTFNYSYRFTPRNEKESSTVKEIIRKFKKHMAPKRVEPNLFLKTPDVFKLKYIYANGDQHPFLNNIKVCALTGFSVDYTPDNSYMTYGDGSMTSYQVNMQFNELDPIYQNDYDEGEGTQGMGY